MDLRDLIQRIGTNYDPKEGLNSPTQRLLRQASTAMTPWIPPGYIGRGSGGQGGPAFVPWIAIFDPDETTSAQHGMYVVYLFAIELGTIVLSLNHGVTNLVKQFGTVDGRLRLATEAAAIRKYLPVGAITGLNVSIELPTSAARPVHYRIGNIAATTYDVSNLPSNAVLVADLRRFITLYETALDVREALRRTQPGLILTTVAAPPPPSASFTAEFKPKNDADYHQAIAAQVLVKTRKHETLVRDYGKFLDTQGFQAATNVHPCDLLAIKNDQSWLIEAKMVRRANGVFAAREALGQLLAYRYFHYRDHDVSMVALFSETIGGHSIDLLEAHAVTPVWRDADRWAGTPAASKAALC